MVRSGEVGKVAGSDKPGKNPGRVDSSAGGDGPVYESIFLLATMPLVRIAAVIGMWSAALVSLVW